MKFAASDINKPCYFALLPILLVLSACTETIPVKQFQDQISIAGHVNCKVELGGFFHEKYGSKNIDDRAVAKLQFTIPEEAFGNKQNDAKIWEYKLAADADNRIVFHIDGITKAGARITSIKFRDNTKNDTVEFNVASAFGNIGYVEQNKNSLFVRLSDSTGIVLSDPSDKADKDRDWSGVIDDTLAIKLSRQILKMCLRHEKTQIHKNTPDHPV